MLIVLTGKTASGKDTILAKLSQKYPDLHNIVTTTSRKIREGEHDDLDYHFISREEFKKRVDRGDFVEFVEYGNNLYGTEKKELEATLNHNAIWKIDPSMAGKVREVIKDKKVLVIYITTSEEVILQRLQERNLTEDEIESRMADDEAFFQEFKDKYDYIIENVPGKLDETVDKIVKILESRAS
ncbi:MAG: guanylate kinase [Microgenomates group bacterium Gr01-1014_7]|nr:MAG: guanylate kinase [Microgenomates group bacterium Gr01-1014_7]